MCWNLLWVDRMVLEEMRRLNEVCGGGRLEVMVVES